MAPPLDLRRLLAPQSIAVIGASERPNAPARRILETLQKLGFPGPIAPVHPTNATVLGLKCYRSLQDVPGEIDAAAFCLDAAHLPGAMRAAAVKGVGAGVVFGAMHGPERDAVMAIAREHGIALCGPNCMGILSPSNKSSLYLQVLVDGTQLSGDVALVTHSGSVALGMLGDCRRYGFSHVISSGEEAVTTLADYLDYLIHDPATRVIAAFVESVRNVAKFAAALDRAARVGKPVIVLKIGRSPHARAAAIGHTGAVAGDGRAFTALLRRHHAIEVTSLEEMAEVLACCQAPRRPRGTRIGVVTASGGQVEMVLDEVNPALFTLPPLTPETKAAASPVIGAISGPGNPLDAWGNGDYTKTLPHGLACLATQTDIDAVVMFSDTNDGSPMAPTRYTDLLLAASERSDKPFYFMNTRSGLMRVETVAKLKGTGVGMLTGLRQGLGAIGRMGRWAQRQDRRRALPRPLTAASTALAQALDRTRPTIHEADTKRILRALDVEVVPERVVRRLDEATKAAAGLGYPVVLKAVSDDIPHRSEHGLVALGLSTEAELRQAWGRLDQRLAAMGAETKDVARLVQAQVNTGVEAIIGIGRDPEIGPFVAFGAGGVLVEILDEMAVRPLPLCEGEAEEMVRQSRLMRLLDGYRGQPKCDVGALIDCIEKVAAFADAERDRIREIDINPILVRPTGQGCIVVDALIVPQTPSEGG